MAKKRKKDEKTKAEEDAEREETHRLGQERIAYHEAKGREQEEAQRRSQA